MSKYNTVYNILIIFLFTYVNSIAVRLSYSPWLNIHMGRTKIKHTKAQQLSNQQILKPPKHQIKLMLTEPKVFKNRGINALIFQSRIVTLYSMSKKLVTAASNQHLVALLRMLKIATMIESVTLLDRQIKTLQTLMDEGIPKAGQISFLLEIRWSKSLILVNCQENELASSHFQAKEQRKLPMKLKI